MKEFFDNLKQILSHDLKKDLFIISSEGKEIRVEKVLEKTKVHIIIARLKLITSKPVSL
jgi:hypothetical protein